MLYIRWSSLKRSVVYQSQFAINSLHLTLWAFFHLDDRPYTCTWQRCRDHQWRRNYGTGEEYIVPQAQYLYPLCPSSQRCGLCQNFKQTTLATRLYKVRTNLYPHLRKRSDAHGDHSTRCSCSDQKLRAGAAERVRRPERMQNWTLSVPYCGSVLPISLSLRPVGPIHIIIETVLIIIILVGAGVAPALLDCMSSACPYTRDWTFVPRTSAPGLRSLREMLPSASRSPMGPVRNPHPLMAYNRCNKRKSVSQSADVANLLIPHCSVYRIDCSSA